MNAMTGKAEFNGTSIVDVTDPAHPRYLKHIPGTEGKLRTAAAPRWCGCATASSLPKGDPNKFYLLRVFGGQGHEIWDVTDPGQSDPADPHRRWA